MIIKLQVPRLRLLFLFIASPLTCWDLINHILTVHKENVRTVIFQKRLGARIIGEQQTQIGAEHLLNLTKTIGCLPNKNLKIYAGAV